MKTRRTRGTGEVSLEPGQSWAIRWRDGGRRRYLGGFASQPEAQAALDVVLAQRKMQRVMDIAMAPAELDDDPWRWAAVRWASMNPREKQAVVFAMGSGRCAYCHKPVTIWPKRPRPGESTASRAVMDHRIPFSAGGSDALANVVLSCGACNDRKGDMDPASARATRSHEMGRALLRKQRQAES